ncbi:MAG: DMT family transporter [Stigonema ocellatum SAG 48.90 = DSM 106950]|nr:DMT family transporter [Stigonema ocellatum SAG 48.90 = DSM 106950]
MDHFGLLRVEQHSFNFMRGLGVLLLIGGVTP